MYTTEERFKGSRQLVNGLDQSDRSYLHRLNVEQVDTELQNEIIIKRTVLAGVGDATMEARLGSFLEGTYGEAFKDENGNYLLDVVDLTRTPDSREARGRYADQRMKLNRAIGHHGFTAIEYGSPEGSPIIDNVLLYLRQSGLPAAFVTRHRKVVDLGVEDFSVYESLSYADARSDDEVAAALEREEARVKQRDKRPTKDSRSRRLDDMFASEEVIDDSLAKGKIFLGSSVLTISAQSIEDFVDQSR